MTPDGQSIQKDYDHLGDIFLSLSDLFRPPERLSVSSAAEKYRYLNNPGAYVGPWLNKTVPYMAEPMDELASRMFDGVIFVGPAQSAKTDALILNWLIYSAKVDPMDLLLFSPTMAAAKDFTERRIDRMHRQSEKRTGKLLLDSRDADNKFMKRYNTGMMLSCGWPSPSQLAGRPVGRVAFTDYDRMEDDIGGEGSPFDLGYKRTTTFGSFRMVLAESSPSRPVTDPRWIARTPHEAPPTTGILSLYNRGDRRKFYWRCLSCEDWFEGKFEHLVWDKLPNTVDAADTVRLVCPFCDHAHHPDDKKALNEAGRWLKDGQAFDGDDIIGEGRRSRFASFWLNGMSASFITWPQMVMAYLDAQELYERTGSEDSLVKHYNTDRGEPYIPKNVQTDRLPEALKARAEPLPEQEVPPNTRFLLATVDVQANMFVVHVTGILPGSPFDMVLIDRYEIRKSKREDSDGDMLWVKPGTYLEDWDQITELVIKKKYPLSDGSGRVMQIKAVGCDSGGRAGVTTNAYNYWRKLKLEGLAGRFHLLKGDPLPGNPRARITFPDSNRRDRKAAARGDVPVILLNSTLLKDALMNRLECVEPGAGMYRFPSWLADNWFSEMCAETKTEKGVWEATNGRRNEAWDLSYYAIGLAVSSVVAVEKINWKNPPGWAAEWDKNDLIAQTKQDERFAPKPKPRYDMATFGKLLA